MTATVIPIVSRESWLQERARVVTSTEVSALFGLSPYVTEFELWHQKRDRLIEDWKPDARMRWGNRLQDAIAAGVSEDMGWTARRLDVFMADDEHRIGSSFDFEAVHPEHGLGLMEIKNVDRFVFADEWVDDESGIEAPKHIELQAQHQMEVSGRSWCAIVPLVGGNEARVTIRLRDHAIGAAIRERVRKFWASVEAGTPPQCDYTQDAEFLARLYGKAVEGTESEADQETETLLAEYQRLGDIAKQRDAIKARILERIGTAAKVRSRIGTLSCGLVAPSKGRLITTADVGTTIGAREGYRLFRFTPKKEKSK